MENGTNWLLYVRNEIRIVKLYAFFYKYDT